MVCCRFRTNSSDTPQMAYLPEPWTDLQVQWCLSVFSIYPRTHLWSWPAHFSSWEGRPFSAGRCISRFLAFFPWLQLLFKDIFKKFLYDLSRPLLYIPSGVGRCLGLTPTWYVPGFQTESLHLHQMPTHGWQKCGADHETGYQAAPPVLTGLSADHRQYSCG